MKCRLAVLAVAFLGLATPSFAHRLDEYLQTTMIAVEQDHVLLRLRLCPGVSGRRKVVADIDTNGDKTIWMGNNVNIRIGYVTICRCPWMAVPSSFAWCHPHSRKWKS